MAVRKCGNCKHRCYDGWLGRECCIDYEMACTEQEEIDAARDCTIYEEGTPDCLCKGEYYSSSTYGDYGPSNPWDAPGMSIRDFI